MSKECIWLAWKKHYKKYGNTIIAIKNSWLKKTTSFSNELLESEKIQVYIDDQFKIIDTYNLNNSYWTLCSKNLKKKNEIIEVDNLVIGAGIGGTYLSARLSNFKPNETILTIDKLDDYGGLQTSTKIPGTSTFIDLGPIRFYPSVHPRVAYLAEKYESPLVEYLPDNNGQVYYLRDKLFTNENLFPGSDSVYNIREDEKGINPFDLLVNNLTKFFPEPEKLADLYSNSVFQPIVQQNISQENWQRIEDILGYNDLLSVKINFIVDSLESLSLSGVNTPIQYRFANGYSSLTKTIANKNNMNKINFNDLNVNSFDIFKYNTLFNTAVLNVEFCSLKNMWKIEIGRVNVSSPEDISYIPTIKKIIYAKTIYSTIPLLYLKNIHKFSNPYLNICENSFVNFQIIRIFLKFDTDWMTERGIGFGKSITTLNGGQLIHYADKVLMFYGFSTQCTKLYNYLPDNIQIQKEMIEPNESTKLLIDECISIIKKSYNIDILPNINGIAYANWIHPIRCFTGRNLQTQKNESLYDTLINIMFPYGKDGNFYVLENNSSFNAAWCEGSLEIVDFYLNLIYNEPLFGEILIK
jgi:hypothetical protein